MTVKAGFQTRIEAVLVAAAKTAASGELAAYVAAGGSDADPVYTAVAAATTVVGVGTAVTALVAATTVLVAEAAVAAYETAAGSKADADTAVANVADVIVKAGFQTRIDNVIV